MGSLLRNAPETASIPGWTGKLALFDEAMEALRAVAARQAEPVSIAVLRRDLALRAAVNATLKFAGIARSYAEANSFPLLANRMRLRPSAFSLMRPYLRVQLAQMVHDLVAPLVPQLEEHGVTAAVLEEFQQQIDDAAAALSAPRDATVMRRAATEELRSAFRRVDAVIENHFDPLLLPLRETHPEFHGRYRAARMLVNHPGRSLGSDKPEAPVAPLAAAPSTPLPNAQPQAA